MLVLTKVTVLKFFFTLKTCRSVYTNVLIVNFNIFMLIKCAFVGQKNFDRSYIFNRLVFITEVRSVYCAVRTESLYNTDTFCP
jgi:hypothetical protein